jgi:hypothetical protein
MRRGRMDSRVEAGRFVVSLWRCDEHPGGIDWVDKCTTMILLREATARAEALREAAERAIAWSHEPYPEDTDLTPEGVSRYLDEGIRAAILDDKQEGKNG